MAKMFEDALRSLGVLADDDPTHVARSVLDVARIDRSKNKAVHGSQGPKGNEKDEDYLELTISPYYESNTNSKTAA